MLGLSFLFSFSGLFVAALLFVNALAVLNEERFLRKMGWANSPDQLEEQTVKGKLVSLLHAVRILTRVPLIAINSFTIVLLLIFG